MEELAVEAAFITVALFNDDHDLPILPAMKSAECS